MPLGRFVVFPTPVGVFPQTCKYPQAQPGLPHARGGVSITKLLDSGIAKSSPRPWGCFHFIYVAI